MLVETCAAKRAAIIQGKTFRAYPVIIDASEYLQVFKFIKADTAIEELFEIFDGILDRFLLRRVFLNRFTRAQNVTYVLLVDL